MFDVKNNMYMNKHTFKASMVERSFAQNQEIYCEKTFSQVDKKGLCGYLLPLPPSLI